MSHDQERRRFIERANPPGLYRCDHCDEVLSGPSSEYRCPELEPQPEPEPAP